LLISWVKVVELTLFRVLDILGDMSITYQPKKKKTTTHPPPILLKT